MQQTCTLKVIEVYESSKLIANHNYILHSYHLIQTHSNTAKYSEPTSQQIATNCKRTYSLKSYSGLLVIKIVTNYNGLTLIVIIK